MLYTNLEFGVFFLFFFVLYWQTRNKVRVQNLLILFASYFFYAWWDWRFLGLIILSSVTDFFVGQQIARSRQHKKQWLWLSLGVNLGLLGVFKYYNFFVGSFIDLFEQLGYQLPISTTSIILPVGISFYTFQTLSYSIDIYRGKTEATSDFLSFMAFVSFFPQLVAGPIERAQTFLPQFYTKRNFSLPVAKDGLRQILWGIFKKVVIADYIAGSTSTLLGYSELYTGSEVFMGLMLFAIQIYCDFSGYSDIAIGLGKLLGFKLSTNFRYPFFAPDMLQFWSRWHISLTSWFKDYVYVWLSGGSFVRERDRMLRNFIATFTISGLWHGAKWTFVIWGLMIGIYQAPALLIRRFRFPKVKPRDAASFKVPARHYFGILSTFILNSISVAFFFAKDLNHSLSIYQAIIQPDFFAVPSIFRKEFFLILAFLLFEWINQHKEHPLMMNKVHPSLRWGIYYGIVLAILYLNYDHQAFIYFQF